MLQKSQLRGGGGGGGDGESGIDDEIGEKLVKLRMNFGSI